MDDDFILWNESSVYEIIKISTGYYGISVRDIGLNILKKYILWLKKNKDEYCNKLSIIYNRLQNSNPIMMYDKVSLVIIFDFFYLINKEI
jgi:hypothetical protein